MDEKAEFLLRVIEQQKPLEELWQEWGGLLDKHGQHHRGIFLLARNQRGLTSFI